MEMFVPRPPGKTAGWGGPLAEISLWELPQTIQVRRWLQQMIIIDHSYFVYWKFNYLLTEQLTGKCWVRVAPKNFLLFSTWKKLRDHKRIHLRKGLLTPCGVIIKGEPAARAHIKNCVKCKIENGMLYCGKFCDFFIDIIPAKSPHTHTHACVVPKNRL